MSDLGSLSECLVDNDPRRARACAPASQQSSRYLSDSRGPAASGDAHLAAHHSGRNCRGNSTSRPRRHFPEAARGLQMRAR